MKSTGKRTGLILVAALFAVPALASAQQAADETPAYIPWTWADADEGRSVNKSDADSDEVIKQTGELGW